MKKYSSFLLFLLPLASFSQGGSEFYNDSTFITVLVLFAVLVLIGGLLFGVTRNLKRIVREKQIELVEPSYYQRKIQPVVSRWNPIIVSLIVVTGIIIVLGGWGYKYAMDEIGVQQDYSPTQPINFSHKLHAGLGEGELQLDCKYCHSTADKSKSASIPSANTCMNCHKYVQATAKYDGKISPEIQKIYDAIGFDGVKREYIPNYKQQPIKWVRIHNLPDLSYFNHSQHVKVGKLECQTCHGPVQEMDRVYQFASLQMVWCLDCHKQRGIDLGNDYYEAAHRKSLKEGKYHVTVAENGGLECGKCHY
jgi:hypothetical protein